MALQPGRARRRWNARSLLAASPGVPLGPNPRVGCVLLAADGATLAEGFHRGAGHRPRRGRRASLSAGVRGQRRDRRGHPRAVQPHRPHRPVRPGAHRRWRPPGRLRPDRPQPGRRRRGRDAAGSRHRRRRRACWPTMPRASTGVDRSRLSDERPFVTVEVRHHPRRAQRRGRRHQPLGLRPCRPARHAPAARAHATSCSSGRNTVAVDDPRLTVRDEHDRPAAPPAARVP